MPPPLRQLARDESGRIGEIMGSPQPNSRLVALRPPGGGLEWNVPEESITRVDIDGNPLQSPQDDA